MNLATPMFTFTTLRSPRPEPAGPSALDIEPSTALARSVVEVIESDRRQPEKIEAINAQLEAFIQSPRFLRNPADVAAAVQGAEPAARSAESAECSDASRLLYETLYDNVLVRTLAKANKHPVFGLVTRELRKLHQRLNAGRVDRGEADRLRIVLPEGLVLSFSPPQAAAAPAETAPEAARTALAGQLRELTEQKRRLEQSIAEYESQIAAQREQAALRASELGDAAAAAAARRAEMAPAAEARAARPPVDAQAADAQAAARPPAAAWVPSVPMQAERNPALEQLVATTGSLQASAAELDVRLKALNREYILSAPRVRYARVGDRWVELGSALPLPPRVEGDSILVWAHGCYLKFPFQVADLRVVKQQVVGYLPGRISHIHNTQQGELHEKTTFRKTTTDLFQSVLTEEETFREKDTTTDNEQRMAQAASEVRAEESSINLGTSVSGTYGVVTASLDAGYSNSQSSQSANSSALSYAKRIVERVVERATARVRREQNMRRVEEFGERVKHVIDNRNSASQSLVYRYLDMLVHAVVENLGMHLSFQFTVKCPSQYYLNHTMQSGPGLSLPADPRRTETPGGPRVFNVDDVTRDNYLALAEYYGAKLEQPPEKKILVSYVNAGKSGEVSEKYLNPIPDGYRAVYAHIEQTFVGQANDKGKIFGFLSVLVGRNNTNIWIIPGVSSAETRFDGRALSNETKFLPISVVSPYGGGFALNVEIECELTAEGERAWQIKCYNAILEAYDKLKAEAESQMAGYDPNVPPINPARKEALIRTELKKGVLSRMYRCNPFWITDSYEVGKVYDPDCCKDTLNGETVLFLESVCDWANMTYELHPYLYADRDNWAALLKLTDDDPHFEAFLQASYATVRVPIFRDPQKETAAVNFILNNSIANYDVVPASMKALLDELDSGEPAKFTTGLNGEQLTVPTSVVDLGIFPVPTDLVILECGVEKGVKPIGFPQKAVEGTDVSIPMQYSPAIIADRCDPVNAGPANPAGPGDPSDPGDSSNPSDPSGPGDPSGSGAPADPVGPAGEEPLEEESGF